MLRQIVRPLLVAASLVVFVAYAVTMFRGPQGLSELHRNRAIVQDLESQNADLRHEIEIKSNRIDKLKNDPNQQEIEIRKRLEMQRHGETIFKSPTAAPVQP